MDGEDAFTLVLDDPSGNSYIESPGDTHDSRDPLLQLEHYERTPEQAAGIGLLPPEPAGERLSVCLCPSPPISIAVGRVQCEIGITQQC